jgi:hypothetical protein
MNFNMDLSQASRYISILLMSVVYIYFCWLRKKISIVYSNRDIYMSILIYNEDVYVRTNFKRQHPQISPREMLECNHFPTFNSSNADVVGHSY